MHHAWSVLVLTNNYDRNGHCYPSQCQYHSANITVPISQCQYHSANITVPISQCQYHSANITVPISQCQYPNNVPYNQTPMCFNKRFTTVHITSVVTVCDASLFSHHFHCHCVWRITFFPSLHHQQGCLI